MKIALQGLVIITFSALLAGATLTDQGSERPDKLLGLMIFLPVDDEIPGWKCSEKLFRASNEEELYRIFNGGASLYIKHGFRSFVGQSYKGPKGTELEVYLFDQGTLQAARDLYENPYAKPSRMKEIAGLGERARIDSSPLFAYGVDLTQKGLFIRVVIQDKTEEGLNVAISFARFILEKVK